MDVVNWYRLADYAISSDNTYIHNRQKMVYCDSNTNVYSSHSGKHAEDNILRVVSNSLTQWILQSGYGD